MYSRSYGKSENQTAERFTVPPDYGGNFYRRPTPEPPPEKEEPAPKKPEAEEKKPPPLGGFLERLTAEDILLFIFLYALLRGDDEENGEILGLVLALLLL